jgi:hypothetical protein
VTIIAAALNEPVWLTIARTVIETPVPDAAIPPPGSGPGGDSDSAAFVTDCLREARRRGAEIPNPGDSIGELAMYGHAVDVTKTPLKLGDVIIINQPGMWIPQNPQSPAAKMPNTSKAHVGFLARATMSQVYVLGEGVIRIFPKKAIGGARRPVL